MKKPIVEPLEDLEALEECEDVSPPVETDTESIEAPKKPRTDKQKAAFALVLQKRNENRTARAAARVAEEAAAKAELESKIVKKAVSIKKKKIKQQFALDEISDDDEPIEDIKQRVAAKLRKPKQPTPPPAPEPPKYTFY